MRILFLTHSFNSLTQRLWCELTARGHQVSIEFDINDAVAEEAVDLWQPELIIAPYLRRAIPASIWAKHVCLVVHPGIVGDRGPSALDWAIQEGESEWGVTLLQANGEMDAGDIWAQRGFPMRHASKASLYRNEVTEAALACVLEAIERFPAWRTRDWKPTPLAAMPNVRGRLRPLIAQTDRAIDWAADDTATVLRKLRAADGFPGVRGELMGVPCSLYDVRADTTQQSRQANGAPGEVVARRGEAVLVKTRDAAVWIGHVKRNDVDGALKLPATVALAAVLDAVPAWPEGGFGETGGGGEILYREERVGDHPVGFLHFEFYNGAMSTHQCRRLLAALETARQRPTQVLVLMGGSDFWCNGIHLNLIEAAASPADESWANINAIDDVCRAIIETTDKLVIAALQGNAGAGGAFLALAADEVWAREAVILNPHYKNMGNLYGSEYWTYLLPRRMGEAGAAVMQNRLPITAREALAEGLVDRVIDGDAAAFRAQVAEDAAALATQSDLAARLADKRARRDADEAAKPLARYREEELMRMRRNFYGFDPSYHVARYHFVRKTPHSWTPRHLALHRELAREAA